MMSARAKSTPLTGARERVRQGALVAMVVCGMAAVACGPTPPADGDGGTNNHQSDGTLPDTGPLPHELSAILIQPTNEILEVDLDTPSTMPYTATGQYLDGVHEDLTALVTWTHSNPAVGAFNGSTLEIAAQSASGAQVTVVNASYQGVEGAAQLTVVAYRQSGSAQDFFFVLPYQDPAGEQDKPLDFSTDVQSLDVFFTMDTSGSMIGEITNLQNALNSLAGTIQGQIVDTWFGAGSYEDFPVDNYGATAGADCGWGGSPLPDQPFRLHQAITSDLAAVQAAVNSYSIGSAPIGCGNDWPESAIEALYQVATGQGLTGPGLTNVPANNTGIGGVGFRQGSMPVTVLTTDAMSHAPGENTICSTTYDSVNYAGTVAAVAHTRQQTKDALDAICGKVVGVASIEAYFSAECTGQTDLEDFATATGARVPPEAWDVPARPSNCGAGLCCTDINGAGRAPDGDGLCPLVFRVDEAGNGLGSSVVTGIEMLTRFGAFDVSTERDGELVGIYGEPLPPNHTTADFIRAVIPNSYQLPPPPPTLPDPTMDAENFYNVTPGTVVSFDVTAFNDFVEGTTEPQLFRAVIRVLAGGCTDLDEREVFILVPPNPLVVD